MWFLDILERAFDLLGGREGNRKGKEKGVVKRKRNETREKVGGRTFKKRKKEIHKLLDFLVVLTGCSMDNDWVVWEIC